MSSPIEVWGGVECTVNRVGDAYFDQLERTGHAHRLADLDLLAGLGLRTLRYPVLWERTAPAGVPSIDWSWADERLTRMKMLGVPYRLTSTVTALTPHELVEWRHPLGHRWRWKFESLSPTLTRVTETFDYRDAGALKKKLKYYERMGFAKANAAGIESTLAKLRDRYAAE